MTVPTAISSKKTKPLVPKLRFPEFSGEWEVKRFSEITNKISDGIHMTPKYDYNGAYHFVNGNNLIDGEIIISSKTKKVSDSEFKKYKRDLTENTILISINGTIGNIACYRDEKIILGKSICYINLKNNYSRNFYFFVLQSFRIMSYFYSEQTGSTIKNLSLKSIKETKLIVPQLPEQQKIANFLSLVYKKILLLQQQQAALETYKKGLLQQIFSQQLRFKDENGTDFPDWEEKCLGEVLTIGSGKDYKHLNKGNIPVYGTGGCMTFVDDFLYDGNSVGIGRKGTIDKPIFLQDKFWTVDTLF